MIGFSGGSGAYVNLFATVVPPPDMSILTFLPSEDTEDIPVPVKLILFTAEDHLVPSCFIITLPPPPPCAVCLVAPVTKS